MKITTTLTFVIIIFSIIAVYFVLNDQREIQFDKENVSGAFEALNFFSYARAYPNDLAPDDAYTTAFENFEQQKLDKTNKISEVDPWTTIGPHNTGGRTLAIAFNPQNPNTMYAGSATGGLWISYSGGVGVDAWQRIETGFPVLSVSTIAIEPNDSNVIYIGTGEIYNYYAAGTGAAYRDTRGFYGIGILKTTDGGASWSKSLDWSYSQQRGIWVVKINPLNPNTVWAGTTEGTYRSYDAGTTWQMVNDVIMVNDLVINPVDTNIVITGNGNFASTGFGIYRTSDDGNSWNKIISNLPTYYEGKILLDIYNADPNIVYASIGHGFSVNGPNASWLCRSTDAGISWDVMTTQDYSQWQGWFSHDVAINQGNPDQLIVLGIAVWKSTDGGATITQKTNGGQTYGQPPIGGPEGPANYTHADAHDVKQHPVDYNIFYVATDGGIFRTTDAGESFVSCNGRYQTHQFYNGTSSSQQDSMFMMGGLQDNSTVLYTGSLAWTKTIGGDGSWTATNSSDDNILFGSSQNLVISKSTNRGGYFFPLSSPGVGNALFIAPYKIFWGDGDIIYAGKDKIFKSTNGGANWAATNNNNLLDGGLAALAMDISYQDENKVFVSTAPYATFSGHLFRTTNGGDSWDNISGILPNRFLADIAVDSNNDNIVYVTFYGFGSGHVYKSTNSGDSWSDITNGLPDVPTVAVIVDPNNSNHVYIGNDLGVFASTDGGNNWITFSEGLPNAVIAMDLHISRSNDVLRVATHGNGAYERKLLSTVVSNVDNDQSIVEDYLLEQNYPNPFNPTTTITWNLPSDSFVSLKIYDLLGKEIAVLVNDDMSAGRHTYEFHAGNLSSGTYYYRLESGGFVETKKMVLLK